ISAKEIQTVVRKSGSLATRQDIYNRIAVVRRESWEGQSPMHALAEHLKKEEEGGGGWWSRFQTDADGRIRAVFFAHLESVAYFQAYPKVLLLDCTYKTNKYRMPLLDFVGVEASQRSFCVAFAFLTGETEEDYVWALEQLKSVCKAPSVI